MVEEPPSFVTPDGAGGGGCFFDLDAAERHWEGVLALFAAP